MEAAAGNVEGGEVSGVEPDEDDLRLGGHAAEAVKTAAKVDDGNQRPAARGRWHPDRYARSSDLGSERSRLASRRREVVGDHGGGAAAGSGRSQEKKAENKHGEDLHVSATNRDGRKGREGEGLYIYSERARRVRSM